MKQKFILITLLLLTVTSFTIAQKANPKNQWKTVSDDESVTISFNTNIETDKRGNHLVWVKAVYRAVDWQWYFANLINSSVPVTLTKTKAMYDSVYHFAFVRQVICYSETGKILYNSGDNLSGGWSPVNASDPVGIVGEYLWDEFEKKRKRYP